VCSALQAKVLEVTPGGQIVWSSANGDNTAIFHAHYVERTLWSQPATISAATGGLVNFVPILGTPHAGHAYGLLASASGTTPGFAFGSVTIPLNYDFITAFTIENANLSPFFDSVGLLDPQGRGTATLVVPPGVAVPATLHFACIVIDPAGPALVGATNPVLLTFVP
jgi:hypothetical protein